MNGNFNDDKNGIAVAVGMVVFLLGFIANVIISMKVCSAFMLIGVPVMVILTLAVTNLFSKGKFSADEKSVNFSVGFSKYEYYYKNIINVRTETMFTNGRGGAKIPHIELAISLRSGGIMRFYDAVPSQYSETLEDLKEYQESHPFTELADYIKSKL